MEKRTSMSDMGTSVMFVMRDAPFVIRPVMEKGFFITDTGTFVADLMKFISENGFFIMDAGLLAWTREHPLQKRLSPSWKR